VTVWHVIEAADQALYDAKRAGRDRAEVAKARPPVVESAPPLRRPARDERDARRIDPGLAQVPAAG
jgi:hypothetical protein